MWCIYVCLLSLSVMSHSLRYHKLQPARLLCPWGFSRQEYWSAFPCFPLGDLPNSGIEPRSPILHVGSFYLNHQGSPYLSIYLSIEREWENLHEHGLLKKPQIWLYGHLLAKWCLCFLIHHLGCRNFSSKEQASFNFMAAVTFYSDFEFL